MNERKLSKNMKARRLKQNRNSRESQKNNKPEVRAWMPLDSKTAIERARTYLSEIFLNVKDLRLEEIEPSSDHKHWLITFSLARPELSLFGSSFANPQRDYKIVTLDASTGEPLAVKMKVLRQ